MSTLPDQPAVDADEETFCPRHPDVATALRCSRCETPICPRCLVQTPVGARCKDCGKGVKSPIYVVKPVHYLRMGGVAVGLGLPVGFVWGAIGGGFIGFFSLFIAAGVGWLMAKGIEWAAAYKRGTTVQSFAVAGILVAYAVRSAFIYDGFVVDIFGLIALAVACFIAIQQLR